MSVRHLALELYRWLKRLEELEQQARARLGPEVPLSERKRLEAEIFQARKSAEHYRILLKAQKEEVKI
ncbi:MAG: hypothetical protein ACLQLE_02970 [Desulfobaccales bacterium]